MKSRLIVTFRVASMTPQAPFRILLSRFVRLFIGEPLLFSNSIFVIFRSIVSFAKRLCALAKVKAELRVKQEYSNQKLPISLSVMASGLAFCHPAQ
jgi:hypothetical protein